MATYRPFEPWKHAQRVWTEARKRGLEVVVAVDDRNSAEDIRRVGIFADQVIPWKSDGHCEDAFGLIQRCSGEFALLVADDEEPSPLCWEFAEHPPFPARFAFPVIPYVSARRMMWVGHGLQERLVYVQGWRWISRQLPDGSMTTFEGHSEGAPQVTIERNPGAVIWHYLLDAPLEERLEKAERYARIDQSAPFYHKARLTWEERPELLHEVPAGLRSQLPKE